MTEPPRVSVLTSAHSNNSVQHKSYRVKVTQHPTMYEHTWTQNVWHDLKYPARSTDLRNGVVYGPYPCRHVMVSSSLLNGESNLFRIDALPPHIREIFVEHEKKARVWLTLTPFDPRPTK